jgi:bis(5'-nucleosyl)-tetraphosphatase (symmetrical)
MRWVVGDVQGCARELDDLLREIRFDPGKDELWSAGDLINRGPDSLASARMWRDLGGLGVIGNHEVYALLARSGRWPRKRDELDALFAAPDADELLGRLRVQPLIVHLAHERHDAWLVHAGLHPRWTDLPSVARAANAGEHDDDWLERDDVSFATRVRCCTVDGVRSKYDREPAGCPPPFHPWDELWRDDVLVVHGHWAWRGHYRSRNAIGLDSGCVYGGRLTAWCQDEDRVVSVPARSAYPRSAST